MGSFSDGFRDGYNIVHPKPKHLFNSLCKPSLDIWKKNIMANCPQLPVVSSHNRVAFLSFHGKILLSEEKGMACDKGQKAAESHLTGWEVEERKVTPPHKWKCERADLCAPRLPSQKKLPARCGHRCLDACSRTDCSDVCIRGPEFMRVFPQKEPPHYFFMITALHCCVALVPTPFPSPWMRRNTHQNKNRQCVLWPFTIMQSSSGPFQEENILTGNEAAAVVTFSPLPSITALQTNHSIQLDLFEHIIRQAFFFSTSCLPLSLFFFFFCINGLNWHIPNNIDTLWSVTSNTTAHLKSHVWD